MVFPPPIIMANRNRRGGVAEGVGGRQGGGTVGVKGRKEESGQEKSGKETE